MPETVQQHSGLKLYLNQISAVVEARLSIPALFMSLPLPEILGRLEFQRRSTDVFVDWWDRHMPEIYQTRFPGSKAKKLRNDLVHNFGGTDKTDSSSDLAFSFPELSKIELHFVDLTFDDGNVQVLSSIAVANDICQAAEKWMMTPPVSFDQDRMNRMLRINFGILEPVASGVPLITMRLPRESECLGLSVRS